MGAKSASFRYQQSGTGWCKARSSSYSNLSSRRISNRGSLDICPSGQHMTRSSQYPRQLSNGRRASSTLTCEPTLTMSGPTGCWKKWHSGVMKRTSCTFVGAQRTAGKAGGRVRITAQLIDALSGTHLWADHFDGSLEDVFDLQDKVASSVAGVIEPALQVAEIRRSAEHPTNDLTAFDLYLRALPHL